MFLTLTVGIPSPSRFPIILHRTLPGSGAGNLSSPTLKKPSNPAAVYGRELFFSLSFFLFCRPKVNA